MKQQTNTEKSTKKYPVYGVLMVSASLVILLLLLVFFLLPGRSFSEKERRNLAKAPRFSMERFLDGSFSDGLEGWLADQFPARDQFTSAAALYEELTGPEISSGVLLGREHTLFQLFEGPGNSGKTTDLLLSFLKDSGIRSTILLVPNAVSVAGQSEKLSSLLPEGAVLTDQAAWFRDWLQSTGETIRTLQSEDRIRLADITAVLQTGWEAGEQIYYKTDHHWTTRGALLGYCAAADLMELSGDPENYQLQEVCRNFRGSLITKSGFSVPSEDVIEISLLRKDLPLTVTYEEEQLLKAAPYSMEGLSGHDPYEVFFGGNHAVVRIDIANRTGRRLLLLKDSYANAFVPFLFPDFDRITMIDPRYYNGDLAAHIRENPYTDVLVLYNINTFTEDSALSVLLEEAGR